MSKNITVQDGNLVVELAAGETVSAANPSTLTPPLNARIHMSLGGIISESTGGVGGFEADTWAAGDKAYLGVYNDETGQYAELVAHGSTFGAGSLNHALYTATDVAPLDFTGDYKTIMQLESTSAANTFVNIMDGTSLRIYDDAETEKIALQHDGTGLVVSGDNNAIATYNDTNTTTDATTLQFAVGAVNDTITRVGGSTFWVEGFFPGQEITITGSASNNGTFSIANGGINAAGTVITVEGNVLANEGPTGAATLVGRNNHITVVGESAIRFDDIAGSWIGANAMGVDPNGYLNIRGYPTVHDGGTLVIFDGKFPPDISVPPVDTDTGYSTISGWSRDEYNLWEIGTFNVADLGLSLNNFVPDSNIDIWVTDVTDSFYRRTFNSDYATGAHLYWPTTNSIALSTDAAGVYSPLGSVYLEEKATPGADTATRGQLWVRNDNPSTLMFTDGDSTDFVVAGGGATSVFSTGTPLNNEVAVFVDGSTIDSDSTFTWDGTTVQVGGAAGFEITSTYMGNANSIRSRFLPETPTSTNPNIIPRGDDADTGIAWTAADQLSLVSGGVEMLRLTETGTATTDQVIVAPAGIIGDANTPALAFGDGDTGFYESSDDILYVTVGGANNFRFQTNTFIGSSSGAAYVQASAGAVGAPTYAINADTDTGMYSPAADAIALTAGGVEGIRFTEASSSVIQAHEANTGLTADVGSAQGNGVITSTYNVYSTVGTAGDAATLPATFPVGTVIYVKNDGANSMDVFPASGDDAGAGLNTAVAVDAGTSKTFVATTADSTWTTLIDGGGSSSVFATGTPLDNQVAIFTNANTIEGDANFTWNGTTLAVTGAATVDTMTLDNNTITASGSLFLAVDGGDSGIDINSNNTISLYTNNVRRFRTDTNGVNITGDLSADTDINLIYWEWADFTDRAQVGFSGNGNFTIDNLVDSGHVNIRAKNSTSATVSILNADPDAGTAIYGTGVEAKRIYGGTVQTTNATQTEVLATDAIGTDQFMGFEVYVIGTETATGDSVYERVFGAIINDGGTTSLVGSNITERTDDAGASGWVITVAADDTADTLTVDVTGEAAHTIDWKCRVELMEI
jgi:hypothetical protein